jgi:hypothetical protein
MNGFDDFDTQITCEEFYGDQPFEDIEQDLIDEEFEDEAAELGPTSYEEYQDLPWGGDDQFETCSYCEDY